MANTTPSRRKANQNLRRYDEFRETLAAPMPNQAYRSEIELEDRQPSIFEQPIKLTAALLTLLLGMRFLANLFTADTANGFVSFLHSATNWLVLPFQTVFDQPRLSNDSSLDLPALAAFIVVTILAAIVVRLARTPKV